MWITFPQYCDALDFEVSRPKDLQGKLAFTVVSNSDRGSVEGNKVFVLDFAKSSVPLQVAKDFAGASYSSFSPDGTKLAFTALDNAKRQIFVQDLIDSSTDRMTNCKVGCDNVTWNKDELIFYSEDSSLKRARLVSVPASADKPVSENNFSLIFDPGARNTTPDAFGDLVIYSTNRFWPGWDICSHNGKQEDCFLSGVQSYCRPRFSPSGKSIAYSGGFSDRVGIYRYNFESEKVEELVDLPGKDYDIAWIDSDSFFFTSENGGRKFDLYYYSIKNKLSKKILATSSSIRFPSYTAGDE